MQIEEFPTWENKFNVIGANVAVVVAVDVDICVVFVANAPKSSQAEKR